MEPKGEIWQFDYGWEIEEIPSEYYPEGYFYRTRQDGNHCHDYPDWDTAQGDVRYWIASHERQLARAAVVQDQHERGYGAW